MRFSLSGGDGVSAGPFGSLRSTKPFQKELSDLNIKYPTQLSQVILVAVCSVLSVSYLKKNGIEIVINLPSPEMTEGK